MKEQVHKDYSQANLEEIREKSCRQYFFCLMKNAWNCLRR